MNDREPVRKDLVLVGGGHTHVHVVKAFGMRPLPGVRITLVAREVHAPYSGMLPGLVAGRYTYDEAHIDLRRLCRWAGVRLLRDEARGLDLHGRRVLCADRPPLAFDLLSLNVGATPRTAGVPGAAEHAVPVKPVDAFLAGWARLVEDLMDRAGSGRLSPVTVAVVGGGAGGVELTLACQWRLASLLRARGLPAGAVRFVLLTDTGRIVPEHHPSAGRSLRRILEARGVEVRTSSRVVRVDEGGVWVKAAPGEAEEETPVRAERVLWVTDVAPAPWIRQTGLDTTGAGFLQVDASLRSTSHPFVFAAGDVASVAPHPRPKSGVFAVRQGPPLERNLRRALQGREPRPHRPQREFLALIGTGDAYAVGARGRLAFRGRWAWRLKEWIDRRWMERWSELPRMEGGAAALHVASPSAGGRGGSGDAVPIPAMRCGGCGGKVGADVLERALGRVDGGRRDDVTSGLREPEDATVLRVPAGRVAVQSVDFFRDFLDDPYRFGAVAAHHALNDLWATGARPRAALAVVTLAPGPEEKLEEELVQLLAGAARVLREEGAVLAGGHTAEGAELAFGLQVTGWGEARGLLRKSGARPGDRLVLTKPLGTGTLFAADMRGEAKARWVEDALASMTISGREALELLRAHGVRACTDVSGFGLLGHLVEMLRASRVAARLVPDALPVLDGALECAGRGILSTLHPANLRLLRAVANPEAAAGSRRWPLLFDPQTAGGLLGALPPGRAEACVADLRAAGHDRAGVVAEVVEASRPETPVELGDGASG